MKASDWPRVSAELDARGAATIHHLLSPVDCERLAALCGAYRVNLRHGVSEVRSGQRHTAGIIFHDAQ